MPKDPSRFRVVEGDDNPERRGTFVLKSGKKAQKVRKYECSECSDELDYSYDALIQLRLSSVEIDGKLIGGETWWCCNRCERRKFLVKRHY